MRRGEALVHAHATRGTSVATAARHAVVDTDLLLAVHVTPANQQERSGSDPGDRTRFRLSKFPGLGRDDKCLPEHLAVLHVVAVAYLMLHRVFLRFAHST